jgi:carbon storage regulator
MLVLGRKLGEKIVIGNNIVITVIGIRGDGQIRLGIEAPDNITIMRSEIVPTTLPFVTTTRPASE